MKHNSKIIFGRTNPKYIKGLSYTMTKFFRNCFDQILVDKWYIDILKNHKYESEGPIIFIPSHKSYFDFILVSYINMYFNY